MITTYIKQNQPKYMSFMCSVTSSDFLSESSESSSEKEIAGSSDIALATVNIGS